MPENKKKYKDRKQMRRANGTGSVYKVSNNRRKPWIALKVTGWEDIIDTETGNPIVVTDKKGRDHIKRRAKKEVIGYFESKTAAQDALALDRVTPRSKKANYTLKNIYDEWSKLKYTDDLSKDTVNGYKAAWKYLDPIQSILFADLRAGDYQEIVDEAGESKSRSSLEKIKALAVMLSEYAMQNDIITQNYGSYIKLPKAERSHKKSFNNKELELIESAAKKDTPFADCVLMMCYSGWRITEFLTLLSENVDLESRTYTGGIKTEAGKDRTIPIHDKIFDYVKKWKDKGGKTLICKDDGSKYASKYFRENCYNKALESINDVRNLDPHECRHTFASLCHAAGLSQKEIMELMGHSDPTVDIKTYIHVDIGQLKKSINRI